MKKFYAVRVGRTPGIYDNWDDCKKNVFKFKGAVYASFDTKEEAQKFMNEELNKLKEINIDDLETYAFVDGSFNPKTNIYGYGGFIIHKLTTEDGSVTSKTTIRGAGNESDMVEMRNISGEIAGSQRAIEICIEKGYKEVTLFYDYAGIENWAKGLWKRNRKGTEDYYKFFQSVKDKINVHFVKVKGHVGIEGNEEADRLAKIAVGVLKEEDSDNTKENK